MPEQTSAAPEGYTAVAPWVFTDDTGAFLDFVTQAFGGEELGRVATEDGLIGHGEIRVGDTVVLAFDPHADWPTMPSLLRVFVADADAAFSQAVTAGGHVVTPLADNAFGQRGGRIRDVDAAAGPGIRRGDACGSGNTRRRAQRSTSRTQQRACQNIQLTGSRSRSPSRSWRSSKSRRGALFAKCMGSTGATPPRGVAPVIHELPDRQR
ncbi:VOC family protein [Amycolatopsis granulosa]|uniref:VOC family protein n=1 Tax=Amycolatopsis granulosa TaxID=185684 RepID=UPI001ABA08A6|nr:VOC family protein [Amycolatopsis granulosa]NIH88154.1 putative glyoxalase superfamily protein PhnB [Amycolatopsis granulosa]